MTAPSWSTVAELRAAIDLDSGLAALLAHATEALDADPGHDVHHALRVGLATVQLAADEAARGAAEPVAWREAVAAALCHDLVNLPKNHPKRAQASALAAADARARLPPLGFAPDAVERVAAAVRDHSYSRGAVPVDALGRALQDADRLEAVGAIGLFRTVSTGARMGARYFDPEDPWAERRPLDDLRQTVDHFFEKLLRLPATMRTVSGRAEATRRAATMAAFLRALALELGAPIPPGRAALLEAVEQEAAALGNGQTTTAG